jgi:hypothetical protein
MMQNLSWEAKSRSAIQQIPRLLWSPKVHYRVHKSPLPIAIPSNKNAAHLVTTWIKPRNPSVRIVDLRAEICTRDLSNTKHEC